MSIHGQLLGAVRAANEAKPAAPASDIPGMDDHELLRLMFSNIRGRAGDYRGLQLTQGGLAIMTSFFRSFEVVFPDQQTFSSRHILYLDRRCSMPWYATAYLPITVTFFEADLAMRAKLVGCLDTLLDAFT